MRLYFYIILLQILSFTGSIFAQFPPAAEQEGSTAIHKDSSLFIDWATGCYVERGFLDISVPESGYVDFGSENDALGVADNAVVSLGDGGMATVTFDMPVANGYGFDFAVFENGFSDTFLELAFVEVSSDGENFYRFDAISLTQTVEQVGSFGELNAEKINNFAGKYRVEYGTPFDLQELTNTSGLDLNHISHIRIIDVVGSVQDEYATFDSQGNKVNDPWPTPFSSGGFDLDAVGVIHNVENMSAVSPNFTKVKIFPNPVSSGTEYIKIVLPENITALSSSIINLDGKVLTSLNQINSGRNVFVIKITNIGKGIFILRIETDKGVFTEKLIIN